MKVRRFFASTMQQALREVKEVMGPDAVILSNRRMDGGVEIVTALDYDEESARESLGVGAADTAGASEIAEMKAERYRALEQEMVRSRERIQQIRGEQRESQPEPPQSPSRPVAAGEEGALARMQAEIHSLRELVERGAASQPSGSSRPDRLRVIRQRLGERLQELGVEASLAGELAEETVAGSGRLENAWKSALKALAGKIRVDQQDLVERGGIHALVGPTGAGKTTTIGKMAARYVLRHGPERVALVTTDRYRVAAHEQLFVFGRILNIPVRVVDEDNSLDQVLDELRERHLVLIDTAGLNPADTGWREQMEELSQSRHPLATYLVMAATSQSRIMQSTWHCYKMCRPAGCMLTKLDEALTLGEVVSFAVRSKLPVAYYTDGQRVPQDLHRAGPVTLVKMAVKRLQSPQNSPQAVSEGA